MKQHSCHYETFISLLLSIEIVNSSVTFSPCTFHGSYVFHLIYIEDATQILANFHHRIKGIIFMHCKLNLSR